MWYPWAWCRLGDPRDWLQRLVNIQFLLLPVILMAPLQSCWITLQPMLISSADSSCLRAHQTSSFRPVCILTTGGRCWVGLQAPGHILTPGHCTNRPVLLSHLGMQEAVLPDMVFGVSLFFFFFLLKKAHQGMSPATCTVTASVFVYVLNWWAINLEKIHYMRSTSLLMCFLLRLPNTSYY